MAFITEWIQPIGNFTLPLKSGGAHNFTVDWGDGSALSTVLAYNDVNATHNYAVAGTYQISMVGTCPNFFMLGQPTEAARLTKVIDWGNMGFTSTGLQNAFNGCINLNTLPAGSITGATGITNIDKMFKGCSSLTAIPESLFWLTTAITRFDYAFESCTGLTILPADLFRYQPNPGFNGFIGTFRYCTGLTTLPADLFRYNTIVASGGFKETFNGCTGLTTLPAGLFQFNTIAVSFWMTFLNCTSLTNVPVNFFRNNTAANTFYQTFYNCPKLQLNRNIFFADGEEATRFLNKSVDFTSCFQRTAFTGIQGEAPALWTCTFGTGTPNKTGCFSGSGNSLTSISNFCYIPTSWGVSSHCQLISTITSQRINDSAEKISITTYRDVIPGETIKGYFSLVYAGLVAEGNLTPITKIDALHYEATVTPGATDVKYYIHLTAIDTEAAAFENIDYNSIHYTVAQVETKIINITDAANYKVFNAPAHKFNHGLIHQNGYLYGSARGSGGETLDGGSQVFKLKADDYSVAAQTKIYFYPNESSYELRNLDQLVYCRGFIFIQAYCLTIHAGVLVRINPVDFTYMLFNVDAGSKGQPIGTDGVNLFVTSDLSVIKLDCSKLIDTPATYGYTGFGGVNLPVNTILGSCTIIQYEPLWNDPTLGINYKVFGHAIISDDQFIYVEVTTGGQANGYNSTSGVYSYHLQKINKNTMVTENDVIIPKSTDDMVQNDNYIFLAPEYANTALPILGYNWGLLAVNKTTLAIKYLKALHKDFNTDNEVDRQAFGVFRFNDKITVQLVNSKKTAVISLTDIDQWGEAFPIGAATEAIYKYQINGVDVAAACNELVIDNNGFVHTNTWEDNTTIFKFSLQELISFNAVSLHNNDTIALLEFLDTHYGCSIRCVQDAPGIATGTTGTAQDQDGNVYDTVVINEKRWMVQNLKTTHFRNGDPVPNITDPALWELDEIGGQCAYNNKPANV